MHRKSHWRAECAGHGTVTLNGVTDSQNNTGNLAATMGVLIGDTTGNGTVNASDVSPTKSKSGQNVDLTNFREDVTANGSINASDVSLVKAKSGNRLAIRQSAEPDSFASRTAAALKRAPDFFGRRARRGTENPGMGQPLPLPMLRTESIPKFRATSRRIFC